MLDFHSHILPCMDDGSKSVEESLTLLDMLSHQGVDTVVATPHFYADREPPESFLARRAESYAALREAMPNSAPQLLLGAEVTYYSGICQLADMKRLCVGDSTLFLLEMPYAKWSEHMIGEIMEIHRSNRVRIVMAHVDRYLKYDNLGALRRLTEQGVLMQVNASFFIGFSDRRRVLKLIKEGYIQFLGSDCHNTTTRAPLIGRACETIAKKIGQSFVDDLNAFPRQLLRSSLSKL